MTHDDEEVGDDRVTGAEGGSVEGPIELDRATGETPGEQPRSRGSRAWSPGQSIDHYELAKYLAGGGYAEVWRAIDQRINAPVALKLLRPELARDEAQLARFRREAELMGRVSSAHVLRVEEPGFDRPQPYHKYRVLQGETLERRLARSQTEPMSFDEATILFTQLLRALRSVHQAQVVHRDVKPLNIFLERLDDSRPNLVLFDFGIAVDLRAGAAALTAENHEIGTRAYMRPGDDGRTPLRDVYAAALVFYEMVVGPRAVSARDSDQGGRREASIDLSALRNAHAEISDELVVLIASALSANADDGPRDGADFLERFLGATAFDPATLTGRAIGERYLVGERLGAGGMGVVYRATDRHTRRDVALKIMNIAGFHNAEIERACRERFEREAAILMQLRHPHIASISDKGFVEGHPYYALELIDGRSLRDAQDELSWAEVTDIIAQVGDALDCAAAAGVVHRDVKLDNVLVSRRGGGVHAHLIDFGIARIAGSQLTEEGVSIGTPGSQAPEQLANSAGVTGQADQWSLAAMVYELLVGDAPGRRRPELDRAAPATHVRLAGALDDVPTPIAAVVDRALSPDPDARYPSTGAFGQALRATREVPIRLFAAPPTDGHVTGATDGPTPMASEIRPDPSTSKRGSWLAVGALVAVAAGVGLWSQFRPADPSDVGSPPVAASNDHATVPATTPPAAGTPPDAREATTDATVLPAATDVTITATYQGRRVSGVTLVIDGQAYESPTTVRRTVGAKLVATVQSSRYAGTQTFVVRAGQTTLELPVRKKRRTTRPKPEAPVEDIRVLGGPR